MKQKTHLLRHARCLSMRYVSNSRPSAPYCALTIFSSTRRPSGFSKTTVRCVLVSRKRKSRISPIAWPLIEIRLSPFFHPGAFRKAARLNAEYFYRHKIRLPSARGAASSKTIEKEQKICPFSILPNIVSGKIMLPF